MFRLPLSGANNNYGFVRKGARNTPQAFSHFSYEFTSHKMMPGGFLLREGLPRAINPATGREAASSLGTSRASLSLRGRDLPQDDAQGLSQANEFAWGMGSAGPLTESHLQFRIPLLGLSFFFSRQVCCEATMER